MTSSAFHLLQVCNVGHVLGGTAACAWTVMKCFPDCRHAVFFLSGVTKETKATFASATVLQRRRITAADIREIEPNLILLHNTPASHCDSPLPRPTVLYRHSVGEHAAADCSIVCSHWLADRLQMPREAVVHQAVPRPIRPVDFSEARSFRTEPVIGRLCTPRSHKWPAEIVPYYERLAERHPAVRWEFVGCPTAIQAELHAACRGRAVFHAASFEARSLLWKWDAMLYHHPSLTESFGRTVAEAMRAGCLPIVDDRGGFREQIADGCGFLCAEANDFHTAVSAVQSPETRRVMSGRAREHAENSFSLQGFRQRLLDRFAMI